MGIGDWGLGIGDWGLGPIPNPQSPIPNPHPHNNIFLFNLFNHFNSKLIRCEDLNKTLKLEIWDTAGQERYRSVSKMFYKDADVVLLVS